jgi:hypothetical protein
MNGKTNKRQRKSILFSLSLFGVRWSGKRFTEQMITIYSSFRVTFHNTSSVISILYYTLYYLPHSIMNRSQTQVLMMMFLKTLYKINQLIQRIDRQDSVSDTYDVVVVDMYFF